MQMQNQKRKGDPNTTMGFNFESWLPIARAARFVVLNLWCVGDTWWCWICGAAEKGQNRGAMIVYDGILDLEESWVPNSSNIISCMMVMMENHQLTHESLYFGWLWLVGWVWLLLIIITCWPEPRKIDHHTLTVSPKSIRLCLRDQHHTKWSNGWHLFSKRTLN